VYAETLERGLAELWIIILQHRYRYEKLRSAVRALRRAALLFLGVLIILIVTNVMVRL
jgi:hypothetical protein